MIRKTVTAALTVALLGAGAFAASTAPSQAGYYGGGYGYYQPYYGGYGYHHCFYKRVQVWGHYGFYWKRIRVC